ncbi:MAG: ATP-binding cassette domain-containing protein [Ignavibacteriae bacterium]|nr:ATP-binding cassette domain-containing protein [Ignavibacteriota bacterium]
MNIILTIEQLEKTYPNGTQALKGISFSVLQGEFLVIIGLSGSGKSTLLRCINRLIEPTNGSIMYRGKDVTHLKSKELREYRKKIGMIFQHFNLIKRRSVMENVLAGHLGSISVWKSIFGKFPSLIRSEAHKNLGIVGIEGKAEHRALLMWIYGRFFVLDQNKRQFSQERIAFVIFIWICLSPIRNIE